MNERTCPEFTNRTAIKMWHWLDKFESEWLKKEPYFFYRLIAKGIFDQIFVYLCTEFKGRKAK